MRFMETLFVPNDQEPVLDNSLLESLVAFEQHNGGDAYARSAE